jgi:peptide/nickel transport system permease protein
VMTRAKARPFAAVLRSLSRDPGAAVGLALLVSIISLALFGPLLYPYDALEGDLSQRLMPPLWCSADAACHPLGTDQQGRDVLSRILVGARISLLVGFSAVAIGGTIGTFLGLVCGYRGGRLDSIVMRLADAQLAIPFIMLAIAVIAVLGPRLQNLVLVLGVTGWVEFGRITRSAALSVRESEFVTSARSVGASGSRIMMRHILPNSIESSVIIASSQLASRVLAEASLSFLGLGVPPPLATWGNMLADGRDYLSTAWWLATWPGIALAVTIMSVNLVGDWVRDLLDPRLRGL